MLLRKHRSSSLRKAFEKAKNREEASMLYYYHRIRDIREDADKTQAEIAEFLNMKQQQYSRYESGVNEIPLHHLISLAKYFDVSIDYLVGLSDVPKKD